jgi:hypothetical protein
VIECLLVALLTSVFTGAARADIIFSLNPGSTLTPAYPGAPSYDTLPLTGTFVWRRLPGQITIQPFQVLQMNLVAGPYTLAADSTPANNESSDTFTNGVTYFNEILDGTGFPINTLWATTNSSGSFTGNFQSPTTIAYTNVGVQTPGGGGVLYALINFSATAIPEPSSLVLGGSTFLILARRRRLERRVTKWE